MLIISNRTIPLSPPNFMDPTRYWQYRSSKLVVVRELLFQRHRRARMPRESWTPRRETLLPPSPLHRRPRKTPGKLLRVWANGQMISLMAVSFTVVVKGRKKRASERNMMDGPTERRRRSFPPRRNTLESVKARSTIPRKAHSLSSLFSIPWYSTVSNPLNREPLSRRGKWFPWFRSHAYWKLVPFPWIL